MAVVVTRYFGGGLLGTGGLVRAYQKAVQEGLAHSRIIEKCEGYILDIHTDYNGLGKLQYYFGQNKIAVLDTQYTSDVVITILVPLEQREKTQKDIIEQTCGTAALAWKEDIATYAVLDKEVILF